MNSLRNLRSFVAVAREGSLAAAASRLALTQSAVSLQLRALEAELKRELFDRGGRSLVLNAAGRGLLPWAHRMLALHDELRHAKLDDADSEAAMTGVYHVGAIVSGVAPLSHALIGLKKRHPKLEVRLTVAKSIELAALCTAGTLDAAVVVRGDTRPSRELLWTPMYEESLVLLAHTGVKSRDAARVLHEQPFLRFDRNQHTGALIQRTLRLHRIKRDDFLELNSIEALVELVRQKVGVALLPQLRSARWDTDAALRVLPLPGKPVHREIGLLQRRDRGETLTQAIMQSFAS
jgi:DNA-binding transcriptional LysR family regulator